MAPTIALTIASLKMYFRNRQALFFSLILPFLIMAIFGVINFGGFSSVNVGVVNEAENNLSAHLIRSLAATDVLDLTLGDREQQMRSLDDGDLDFLLVLPAGFGLLGEQTRVQGFFNASRPQEAQVGATVVARGLDDLTFEVTGTKRLFEFETLEVEGKTTDYADFLVPGIIAMSIMQMGLFGVTFAIIQYRQQGILRRMRAAPIHPGHFLAGQVITRLIVSIVQTLILVGAGVLFLGVDLRGSVATLLLLAVIGGGLFISMGYAISGFTRSEETAAPITNLIALPLMFLSGVFFSRENLPGFLELVTDFSPLTYLAEGMREVVAGGSGLTQISGDIAGLVVWLAISFLVATRLFRWE